MGRLDTKVALITGAGSGIGRATALLFAQEGAKVGVSDCVPAGGQQTISMIRDNGGEALFIEADVTRPNDVERMVKITADTYGQLDILFNNAGISSARLAFTADLTLEEWDLVINTNLRSAFLGSKFAIPTMLQNGGGVIINTSSVNGLGSNATIAPYCASKAGVILLTKTMAAEYGKQNIRVNCICPGMIDTPMVENAIPILDMGFVAQGRAGRPDEVARAALFLACDEASYINGAHLVVDGGWSAEAKIPLKAV